MNTMSEMSDPVELPADFTRTIVEVHGDEGRAWLARFPSLLCEAVARWSLTISSPFPDLSYNYVAPAVRADGVRVVLKAGVPCSELFTEIDALAWYDGRGIVQLLDVDRERGIILLERLMPGTSLLDVNDERRSTSIAASIMRRLWRPAPLLHGFPSVADWGGGFARMRDRFNGGAGPFPPRLVDAAERLFNELLASVSEPLLLHGDLHHGNILTAEREPWLAIDPKGVTGDPAYEIGAYLRNPLPRLLAEPHPERVLAARIDQFAEELELDRARIARWGFAQAVLSAWWTYEDHGRGWEPGIACAEYLAKVMERR